MTAVASHLLQSGFLPSTPSPASQVSAPSLLSAAGPLPDELYGCPSRDTPILHAFQPSETFPDGLSCDVFFELYPEGGRCKEPGSAGVCAKSELIEVKGWSKERWSSHAVEAQVYERAGLVDVKDEAVEQEMAISPPGENEQAGEPTGGPNKHETEQRPNAESEKSGGTMADMTKTRRHKRRRMSEVLMLQRSLGTAGWTDSREIMALKEAVIVLDDDEEDNQPRGGRMGKRETGDEERSEKTPPRRIRSSNLSTPTKSIRKSRSSRSRTLIQSSLITPPRRARKLKSSFVDLLKPSVRERKTGRRKATKIP